jgi:hypothetical protein
MVILLFLSFQVFMKLNEEKFAKFEKYDIKNKEGFVVNSFMII